MSKECTQEQGRAWPEAMECDKDAIRHLFDVRSPMRDGIELSSDVWLPHGLGSYPVILIRTPYLKSSQSPQPEFPKLARYFVARGYAVAVQDVRGRGDSQGEFGYYFQEGRDGYDTVEWMARQSWCNGRVGMMGVSYQGAAQWLAARENPPHLVCIAPTSAPGDYLNELPYVGGAFLQHRLLWCNLVSGTVCQTNLAADELAHIWRHRPLLTADERMGRKMPLYRAWLQHDTLDEYWKPLLFTEEDFRTIDIPALHITGWFDSTQAGVMRYWHGMREFSPAASGQYLIVGPWDHTQTFTGGGTRVGELEFTDESIIDTYHEHLEFFDRYLGQKRGTVHPPVRLYVTGRNAWKQLGAYPTTEVETVRLYFSSDGRANSLNGDGRLINHTPGLEPCDQYKFDPTDPVPLDPLAPGGIYGMDRRDVEKRNDVLVYTSNPLNEPMEIIGPAGVELYALSDSADTDFTASVADVFPDGRAVALGARVVGIIRARYRTGMGGAPRLLEPETIQKYHIDLGHFAHSFERGHRIRVEISSSAAPMYNPNQNTGNPVATDTEWRVARQYIFHDLRYPSALILLATRETIGRSALGNSGLVG